MALDVFDTKKLVIGHCWWAILRIRALTLNWWPITVGSLETTDSLRLGFVPDLTTILARLRVTSIFMVLTSSQSVCSP